MSLFAIRGREPGGKKHIFVGGPHEVYGGGDERSDTQDIEREKAGEEDGDEGYNSEED